MSNNEDYENVDPIDDIIDYLVRCANISFKTPHHNEKEIRTCDKINLARKLYSDSPTEFLLQYGKYLSPNHINYFESCSVNEDYAECVQKLKEYHSETSKRKRIRNRRYKALQRMQTNSDYFSEKQMMYRNPLLYEQLVGQYLTDEEIRDRVGMDTENISFLNLVLETVDHNNMREVKNQQMLQENEVVEETTSLPLVNGSENNPKRNPRWGDFTTPDTKPSYIPETRKKSMINAPEKKMLYEEFCQEMYSSFIEGNDDEIDYDSIDNDEQYDDIQQESQDAEDKYFDSETNDISNLEQHMKLVQEYSKGNIINDDKDSLDIFMERMKK